MYFSQNYKNKKAEPSEKDFLNKIPLYVAIIVLFVLGVASAMFSMSGFASIFQMFFDAKLGIGILIAISCFSAAINALMSYVVGSIFASWFASLTKRKLDIYFKHFINIYLWFRIAVTIIVMLFDALWLFVPQTYYLVQIVILPILHVLLGVGMIFYLKRAYVTDAYYNHLVIKGVAIPTLTFAILNMLLGII